MKKTSILSFLLLGFCLFFTEEANAQTKAAQNAYYQGMRALDAKNYPEATKLLSEAAQGNMPEAFAPLVDLYVEGDYNGSGAGNYKEALKWIEKAADLCLDGRSENKELWVLCMLNYPSLRFLTGEYKLFIDEVTKDYSKGNFPKAPYVMLQVAASYIHLGDYAKAKQWIADGMALGREQKQDIILETGEILLAKISFDNKDYNAALNRIADFPDASPVSAYIYGASLIKTGNHPELGKEWVRLAAEYKYNGLFEINCFEKEILQYWNSIKNQSF